MNQQAPKLKPHFGFSKYIDGVRSLREFSLKKYKHLSKLKVIKSPNVKIEQNPRRMSILHKLSVSVKSLDLLQYGFLETYSRSQIKLVAKKFYKITRFSPFPNKKGSKSFLLTLIMLKKAKNLKHLCLKALFDSSSPNRLLHLISRIKLKTLDLIPMSSSQHEPTWLINYLNCLPSTVEELCFYWKKQMGDGSEMNLSINHLDNLQKLELRMPLSIEIFTNITESIQDPSKLKTLRFHLEKSQNEGFDVSYVQAFLGNCSNLEELNIQTDLDVFPSHLSMMKLKKLTIESTEGLLRIMQFIQQQKDSLESLNLTSKLWNVNLRDGFLDGLKPLKKLKKLKLNVKTEMFSLNALDLTELIEAFEYLEEVDFVGLLIEFKDDSFEKFCKALQKRSGSLKSLKLSLNSWSLNVKSLSVFIETLKSLSRLEHMTFKDFETEDASFYSKLSEIVCFENQNLNEVILDKVKREKTTTCCENLIKMLQDIIKKPKMKQFRYLDVGNQGFASDFKDLKVLILNDVLKDVHHFDYLHLPSYTCKPSFYYWDLGLYKWTENLN